jgi:small subunit ribosomal protein S16
MATRIRLRRMGSNKRPFYRVVVADQRAPRDGRFIESIGKYHPLSDPSLIEIDEERALHWLRVGAQPSNQVRNLMSKVGIWEKFVTERPGAMKGVKPPKTDRPDRPKLSKKAQARAAEAEPVPAAPAAEASASDETAAGDGTPDAPAEQPAAPSEAEPEVAQEVADEAQAEAGEE